MTVSAAKAGSTADERVELASNENPFGASPKAMEAMRAALSGLNRYPPHDDGALRRKLAETFGRGLTPDNFFAANGGVEVLSMIEDALMTGADSAIICPPAFRPYRDSLTAKGFDFTEAPLTRPDFLPDPDAILAAVTERTRLLYLTNPNNPTGTRFGADLLARILDGLPDHVTVIYDEVYWQFADGLGLPDSIGLIRDGRNLIAVHSFSKIYGLAGARVGYAIAPERLIAALRPRRRSYQINTLGLAGALAALDDVAFLAQTVANNTQQRPVMIDGVRALGLTAWDSAANFVMFRCPDGVSGKALSERLAQSGVLVRPAFDLPDHVRVTVGQPQETAAFLQALKEVL